jgi:hypothetical protein
MEEIFLEAVDLFLFLFLPLIESLGEFFNVFEHLEDLGLVLGQEHVGKVLVLP